MTPSRSRPPRSRPPMTSLPPASVPPLTSMPPTAFDQARDDDELDRRVAEWRRVLGLDRNNNPKESPK